MIKISGTSVEIDERSTVGFFASHVTKNKQCKSCPPPLSQFPLTDPPVAGAFQHHQCHPDSPSCPHKPHPQRLAGANSPKEAALCAGGFAKRPRPVRHWDHQFRAVRSAGGGHQPCPGRAGPRGAPARTRPCRSSAGGGPAWAPLPSPNSTLGGAGGEVGTQVKSVWGVPGAAGLHLGSHR